MADQPFWNPLDKDSGCTLSNSDRTAQQATSNVGGVRTTTYQSAGKWYVEIVANTSNSTLMMIGFANSSYVISAEPGATANSWLLRSDNGKIRHNAGDSAAYGSSFTTNDIIMMALDLDNGKVWWGENGTWHASGDPAAGTNAGVTGLSGAKALLFGSVNAPLGTRRMTLTDLASYSYSPPSGFSAGWGSSGPTTHDQALSAAITLAASIRKTVGKHLSAAATMTATLARIAVFPLAMLATMTLSASMRKEIAKFLSGTLTGTASIVKLVGKGLAAGFNLTGLITKAFPLALSASLSLSASIQRTITKGLIAVLGLTGVLQRIKVAVVSMSTSVTLTASLLAPALFSRALTASIDLSASMRRTIAKNLSVALPAIAKPLRWVAQQYAAFRNDKPNWNQCPRCSRRVRPNQMHRQMEYRGPRLVWTGLYVCKSCIDEPQPQEIWPRKTGGDPRPVLLARPRRD